MTHWKENIITVKDAIEIPQSLVDNGIVYQCPDGMIWSQNTSKHVLTNKHKLSKYF